MSGQHRAMDRVGVPHARRFLALAAIAAVVGACGLDWTVAEGGGAGAGGEATTSSPSSGGATGSATTGAGGEGGGASGGSSTASSTSASTTASSGGAGGSGGAPTCEEASGDCPTCSYCAEAAACAAQTSACLGDDYCTCVYECDEDFCAECEFFYWEGGDALWASLAMCVVCNECPGDCAEFHADWCT